MLNIIYGLENSDRDDYAKAQIEKKLAEGKNVWILVPEQFSMSTEKEVIKRFGISAQTRVRVVTFSRLCNLVFAKKGPLRMKYIDGAGKQIIAARVVRSVRGRTGALTASLARRGFSATVVDLVSEFKRYGITAEALLAASDECENDELMGKIKDLSLIYREFDELLEKSASDAEDNLSLILPKIKDCDFLNGELYITHFRSFTPIEHKIIGELMCGMNVTAVMCCDDIKAPSSLFLPITATYERLVETATEQGVSIGETVQRSGAVGNPELIHLADNYFKVRPKPFSGEPTAVNVYSLSSAYREVEATADLILKLCREEGYKFSDFLVLARDTTEYNRIMPAIFEARGIDVFLDTRRSMLTKPLCTMLCSVLEIMAYGYSFDRVMSIARSGILPLEDSDIDAFENYLLAVNPSHAMWSKERWDYCPEEYDMEQINQTRWDILGLVQSLNDKIKGRKTADGICGAILSVMEERELSARVQELCEVYANAKMGYLSEETRQVWNSVISVISQISVLMDSEPITWRDFAELFKNACSGISVGMTPQSQGSVSFAQIDRFRSSKVPVVIVLGVTDGVFPLAHTAEGLLSDAEREELLRLGVQLAQGADFKRREEQLLIYSVLTAARDRLYLFAPMNESDGKPLTPSSIIKTIRNKLFPELKVYNPDLSGDVLRGAEGRSSAFDVLCSLLARCGGDKERLAPPERELYVYFEGQKDYSKRLCDITDSMRRQDTEKLSRTAVEAIYGKTIMLSASKLEKYNACAFSYFMSYGLLASEREKAGIEPRSTGSIQHEALCKYFSGLKERDADYSAVSKEECFAEVYDIVKTEAVKNTELLYESSSYYKFVVSRMQGIAARTAWEVVKFYRSSRFRPVGYEIEIKTKGEIPSVEVKQADKTIAVIRGIIDRADSAVIDGKTYISIVDYKSSAKGLDERLAEAGVHIQPLLYSDIICKRMNASPAAMLYMQMTDPIVEESKLKQLTEAEIEKASNGGVALGGWLNDDAGVVASYSSGGENGEKYTPRGRASLVGEAELKRRIEVANKKIQESAIGIYEGNVKAEPYIDKGFDACQYCIFGRLCGEKRGE